MSKVPTQYQWIHSQGTLPRMIQEALALYGTKEIPGNASNPVILGWAKELGRDVSTVYTSDEIPWCGLFHAVIAQRAGKPVIDKPLWARNWAKWEVEVARNVGTDSAPILKFAPGMVASLGDTLVFVRNGGGHVGQYLAEDLTHFHVLGANQQDQVNIMRIPKGRCIAIRRPRYKVAPASAKPFKVKAIGAISDNER